MNKELEVYVVGDPDSLWDNDEYLDVLTTRRAGDERVLELGDAIGRDETPRLWKATLTIHELVADE